jgi:hypothetical protein
MRVLCAVCQQLAVQIYSSACWRHVPAERAVDVCLHAEQMAGGASGREAGGWGTHVTVC